MSMMQRLMQHGMHSTTLELASKVHGMYLWVWCEEIVAHWAGSINHLFLVKLGHEIIPVIIVGLSFCLTVVCHQRGLGRKRGKEGKRGTERGRRKEAEGEGQRGEEGGLKYLVTKNIIVEQFQI